MRLCSCAVHVLGRWMRSCSRRTRSRLPRRLREPLSYTRLIFNSLCHNSLLNCDLVTDSLFEPVFWMVDIVTRWFGMVSLALPPKMFFFFILFYGSYTSVHIAFCCLENVFFFPLLLGLCVSSDSSHQLRPLSCVCQPPPFGP